MPTSVTKSLSIDYELLVVAEKQGKMENFSGYVNELLRKDLGQEKRLLFQRYNALQNDWREHFSGEEVMIVSSEEAKMLAKKVKKQQKTSKNDEKEAV